MYSFEKFVILYKHFYGMHPEYGSVYVAKKNGGADDGKLYALKAINITDAHVKNELPDKEPLNTEREVRH